MFSRLSDRSGSVDVCSAAPASPRYSRRLSLVALDMALDMAKSFSSQTSRIMSITMQATMEQVQPHAMSLKEILQKYIYGICLGTCTLLIVLNLPLIYALSRVPWHTQNPTEPIFDINPVPFQLMMAVQAGLPLAFYPGGLGAMPKQHRMDCRFIGYGLHA